MDKAQVVVKWEEWHRANASLDEFQDSDFRDICIGFCMALGLTYDEASYLYQGEINKGFF